MSGASQNRRVICPWNSGMEGTVYNFATANRLVYGGVDGRSQKPGGPSLSRL